MEKRTYLDSSVIINAFVRDKTNSERALAVLLNPDKLFVVSDYVNLETVAKMNYQNQIQQMLFTLEIFHSAVAYVHSTDEIIAFAEDIAKEYGLAAMDALHVSCAIAGKADELLTFEKPTKPFFRIPANLIKVVSLYQKTNVNSLLTH